MKKIKIRKRGFTLLELLVVVLIIGILAGIALPQYQMAVGKSKFATLKDNVRLIKGAMDRYYMVHDDFTKDLTNLDIELKGSLSSNNDDVTLSDGSRCFIGAIAVFCRRKIFGVSMEYSVNYNESYRASCNVKSTDTSDKGNRLCQQETGKTTGSGDTWTVYNY